MPPYPACFLKQGLTNFFPGLASTCIPPIFASQVAGIMNYHAQLLLFSVYI
jgi:hypothetical protein